MLEAVAEVEIRIWIIRCPFGMALPGVITYPNKGEGIVLEFGWVFPGWDAVSVNRGVRQVTLCGDGKSEKEKMGKGEKQKN